GSGESHGRRGDTGATRGRSPRCTSVPKRRTEASGGTCCTLCAGTGRSVPRYCPHVRDRPRHATSTTPAALSRCSRSTPFPVPPTHPSTSWSLGFPSGFPVSGDLPVDLPGGRGAIRRDEVDARRTLGEEPLTHALRVLDTELTHGLGVVAETLETLGQVARERRARQFLRARDERRAHHREDLRNDGHVTPTSRHPVTQTQILLGVEEHLGDGVVGPRLALAYEVVGVGLHVGRTRVFVGEGSHSHAEVAGLLEQPNELLRVGQSLGVLDPLAFRVSGWVTAH